MVAITQVFALCAALLADQGHGANVSSAVARATCEQVVQVAQEEGVPPALAVSLAWHESRFDPKARGPRGARGPMQVMPATQKRLGPGLVRAGVRALDNWMDRSGGDRARAVCHYRSGTRCGAKSLKWARGVVRMAGTLNAKAATGTAKASKSSAKVSKAKASAKKSKSSAKKSKASAKKSKASAKASKAKKAKASAKNSKASAKKSKSKASAKKARSSAK